MIEQDLDYRKAKREFERNFLIMALSKCDGGVNKTAKAIRISKATLIEKIRTLEIDVDSIKIHRNLIKADPAAAVTMPMPADLDDAMLAERARRALARGYVEKAVECRKNREHEAERLLLWFAVEAAQL